MESSHSPHISRQAIRQSHQTANWRHRDHRHGTDQAFGRVAILRSGTAVLIPIQCKSIRAYPCPRNSSHQLSLQFCVRQQTCLLSLCRCAHPLLCMAKGLGPRLVAQQNASLLSSTMPSAAKVDRVELSHATVSQPRPNAQSWRSPLH